MIPSFALFATLALASQTPDAANESRAVRTYGQQTFIIDAGNGGIRRFDKAGGDGSTVYLQDRRQRWYQVVLTGPCFPDQGLDTIVYRTHPDGRFDRFSNVGSTRYPGRTCGVTSVLRSDAPPGQPPERVPTPRELAGQPRG